MEGIYRDTLYSARGELLHDSDWKSNTIVNGCRLLLAGFMKNEGPKGIQFLAVGEGLEKWDDEGIPAIAVTTNNLTTRYNNASEPALSTIPFAQMTVTYLDENDQAVTNPTNRLKVEAELKPGYPVPKEDPNRPELKTYPLREFGLFGLDANGNEFMINCIRHPLIHKDKDATLKRTMKLYF